jgi:DNA adenine methylase
MSVIVPPIKCQGIKTKIVPVIKSAVVQSIKGKWIEPFCGSCVVAFNIQPQKALLADTNQHIIAFYSSLQNSSITVDDVISHLQTEGKRLKEKGEEHYYEIRRRFNQSRHPLDFLFLNRSCFNGVIRFNSKGEFNTPFCRKPERFSQSYITKIANQVRAVCSVMHGKDWTYEVADFKKTLSRANEDDLIYADPPYIGRHADYFNKWSDENELELETNLKRLNCKFILSTWQQNKYRCNERINECWNVDDVSVLSVKHFYHVGSTESLRNEMMEAVITNCPQQVSLSL